MALGTVVINPTVLVAPDNTLVLFYSGEPLPARYHKNCTPGDRGRGEGAPLTDVSSPKHKNGGGGGGGGLAEPPGPPGYEKIGCVLSIATSASWDSPFDARLTSFTPAGAEGLFCHTNPAAWIFPNGTTLLFFRSATATGANETVWLATAPHDRATLPRALHAPR